MPSMLTSSTCRIRSSRSSVVDECDGAALGRTPAVVENAAASNNTVAILEELSGTEASYGTPAVTDDSTGDEEAHSNHRSQQSCEESIRVQRKDSKESGGGRRTATAVGLLMRNIHRVFIISSLVAVVTAQRIRP